VPAPEILAGKLAKLAAGPSETIARIHWLGRKQIATDTNGIALKGVWAMPETVKLEAQTLDKLSLASWSLSHRTIDTNTGALLRPLLEDVVQQEFYLEIRQVTNEPGQLVLAVRLDDARAGLWETNLAAVLESLTGIRPVAATGNRRGWSLWKHHVPNLLELARAGEWTLIGSAQDHNALLEDMLARVRRDHVPFESGGPNRWLEADLDFSRIAGAFSLGLNLPADFPKISFAAVGEGTNVHTFGTLAFSRPLSLDLEPWNIPTDLIDQAPVSFTTLRGVRPWLASVQAWNELQIGPPPNQFFIWALHSLPMQTYFVAPLTDASNEVRKLTDFVLQKSERWFASNDNAGFRRSQTTGELEWNGLPYLWPYLQSVVSSNGGAFVLGGTFPHPGEPWAITPEMLPPALSRPNLVYHDWEVSGARVENWVYIGQFFRFVFQRNQLPDKSTGMAWLSALETHLGQSVTDVIRTAPDQLSFDRKSSIGFTGIELNLLADWLESPQFPIGLHTFCPPP
jgi:hypothetical protein